MAMTIIVEEDDGDQVEITLRAGFDKLNPVTE
jgi:hypothetical protein